MTFTWTSEKPTVPGYYWYRGQLSTDGDIVELAESATVPTFFFMGNDVPYDYDSVNGEWAGPIEPPTERA